MINLGNPTQILIQRACQNERALTPTLCASVVYQKLVDQVKLVCNEGGPQDQFTLNQCQKTLLENPFVNSVRPLKAGNGTLHQSFESFIQVEARLYKKTEKPQVKRRPADGKIITVTDTAFDQEVIKSSIPVLVFFTAKTCRKCGQTLPAIRRLAKDFSDRVKFAVVDVEYNKIHETYGVRGLPTLLLFKEGVIKDQMLGGPWPKSYIEEMIRRFL